MAVDRARYEKLLASFRSDPGNVNAAARAAKTRWPTAHQAWERGWPERELRPIREVLREEQHAAREMMATQLTEEERARIGKDARRLAELERVRLDAAEARREEALVVRTIRQNVMALAGATAYLTQGALKLGERLQVQLLEMAETNTLDARDAVWLVRAIAAATKNGAEAARLTLQMERLLLGEPTEILGLRGAGALSTEEHLARIERAARGAERFKQRLRLVQGGGGVESRGDQKQNASG